VNIVNLGILAHVDAGKTSLTERLLYAAGVIDAMGRVDDGSTQTDSLALEQQRGERVGERGVLCAERPDIGLTPPGQIHGPHHDDG